MKKELVFQSIDAFAELLRLHPMWEDEWENRWWPERLQGTRPASVVADAGSAR